MPRVLISDKLSPRAADILKAQGIEVDFRPGLGADELLRCIADYDGLAVRSETKVTGKILETGIQLKVIGRAGIGVDNVDVPAATARGIVVMNTPFGNSVTTAEHTIAMMMALARQIPQANASTHAGKWEKSKFMGTELAGKTLAVLGCGNIGSIVANRAMGLQMRVIAYDPYLSTDKAASLGVTKVETVKEAVQSADFVTIHTPLTESTKHLINRDVLQACQKGVRILNCARGGLVDETALKDALASGHVAGAALDVFEAEPAKENALFGMEEVICTPHLGASTSEAQENVAIQIAEQMASYLLRGEITNAVNFPNLSASEAAELRPYLLLAKQMGQLAGQVSSGGFTGIQITYEGEITRLNTRPLSLILMEGLFSVFGDTVNMVNAPHIAARRGIELKEVRSSHVGDYKTVIGLKIRTDSGSHSLTGTLYDGHKPRIVEIDGIRLEATLHPIMLYVENQDKPGLIGNVGNLLGEAHVNIANFHLGRNADRTRAVAIVSVDTDVPDSLLQDIRAVPNVLRAMILRF